MAASASGRCSFAYRWHFSSCRFYACLMGNREGWAAAFSSGDAGVSDDGDPGVYQLWATYHPPAVGVADLKILQEGSIDIPRSRLESNHLTFVKKR
jgi:hypothetical protein